VSGARRIARQRAAALGADDDAQETVATLVSELVTNVVLHARTPALFAVLDAGERVRVTLTDGSRARPRLRRLGPVEATGRGMRLVGVLAADSGVERSDAVASGGKTVWFAVPKATPAVPEQARLDAMLDLFDVDDLGEGEARG